MSASLGWWRDPDPALRLKIVDDGPVTVLAVIGDLDLDTADELTDAVGRLAARDPLRMVLDCAQVGFCGAAGLTALLRAQATARRVSAELVLLDPPPALSLVLDAAACTARFPIRHTTGSARRG